MKNIKTNILFVLFISIVSLSSFAQHPIVDIPDKNFKKALLAIPGLDKDGDKEIQVSEANNYKGSINVSGKRISNLKGIEAFTAITRLFCSNNQLTEINVSSNTLLSTLFIPNNRIEKLDVSKCTQLTTLECYNNQLNAINLKNINIGKLNVFKAKNNPPLSCIQVDDVAAFKAKWSGGIDTDKQNTVKNKCEAFGIVDIPDTNFKNALLANTKINKNGDKEIQVSEANSYTGELYVRSKRIVNMKGLEAFTKITKLNCSRNQITNIDLSKNTLLQSLDINGNRTLPSLDVSHNTLLTFLDLRTCRLITSIDLSKNILLSKLDCGFSGIKNLDVSKNPALTQLSAFKTGSESLDLTQNPKLTYLKIYANNLKTIDLSKNVLLEQLFIQDNDLISLDIKANTKITKLVCFNNEIPKLDIATNTQLEFINCSNNKFTTLDISKNINLTKFHSKNNGHTSLDFSKNTKLVKVHVSGNKLQAIDLSNHPALTRLRCEENTTLASIIVTKSTALKEIQCYKTSIKTLDLSKQPNLSILKFNDNTQLSTVNLKNGNSTKPFTFFFDAKNLPALTCLQVDDPVAFKNKYKSKIDANKLDVIKSDCIKKGVNVQKITIAGANKIDKKGGNIKLTATVDPDNATNKELAWTVDKADMATLEVKTDHVLLTAKADGEVTVTATAKDGSGVNTTHKVAITNQQEQNVTSIDDVNSLSDLVLYPNPAQNRLSIDTNLTISSIEITDLAGKSVRSVSVSESINIENLRPNIYLLKIHTDNKVIVRKFVKE